MAPTKSVYLAGPIVGVEYGAARNWRRDFAHAVRGDAAWTKDTNRVAATYPHIHFYSPMRGRKLMESDEVVAPGMEYTMDDPLENAKSMLARDTNDVRCSDMVVVNLLGAKRAALGTTAEMGFAYALNIPILLIMEKTPVFHTHGFITGMASYWVDNIDEAVYVVQTLLTPGV
jgi:nucleoside 2-deoxyribosyltransferase